MRGTENSQDQMPHSYVSQVRAPRYSLKKADGVSDVQELLSRVRASPLREAVGSAGKPSPFRMCILLIDDGLSRRVSPRRDLVRCLERGRYGAPW